MLFRSGAAGAHGQVLDADGGAAQVRGGQVAALGRGLLQDLEDRVGGGHAVGRGVEVEADPALLTYGIYWEYDVIYNCSRG